jgi:hypothetical protein
MLYIPDIVPEADPVDGLISRQCMAKYLLGLLAEDFSQTYHLVSWTKEVPYHFWAAAHGAEVDVAFGKAVLSSTEKKLILDLAIVSNGWWVDHPDFANPVDSFISLEEWRARIAAHNKA